MQTVPRYAVWILVGSLLAAAPKAGAADAGEAARGSKNTMTQTASGTKGAVTPPTKSEIDDVCMAAFKGDTETVDRMLQAKPVLVNVRALDGRRPLHYGVCSNSTKMVKLLLAYGAAVDATDLFGITPLHTATAVARIEIAALLIEHGAPVNHRNRYGKTPLGGAIKTGSKELIDLLLQHGGKE